MKMSLVAEAVVEREVNRLLLGDETGTLTVGGIVEEYGLEWGKYIHERGDTGNVQKRPKAEQHVRNAVNAQFRRGSIGKLADKDGHLIHEGHWVVYVIASTPSYKFGSDRRVVRA